MFYLHIAPYSPTYFLIETPCNLSLKIEYFYADKYIVMREFRLTDKLTHLVFRQFEKFLKIMIWMW